ncbi:MAG: NHL repeat-containing protein [Thermoguttaceae bacterium]
MPFRRILLPVVTAMAAATTTSDLAAHPNHPQNAPKESRSVTDEIRTGNGACTYQTVPNWCKLPEGRPSLGPTHGSIVIDKTGRIYCSLDSGDFGILVYGPDGAFLREAGRGLAGIHGMCLREEGGDEFIYAAHLRDAQVLKLSLDGEVVWAMKGPPAGAKGYDDANAYKPTAVAVGPAGEIFVADGYGANWIHRFDKDRNYLGSFGSRGTENGRFQTCHGLALDTRGPRPLLLVCDRENRRLQHYDLEGNFVATIAENLRRPCSVAFFGDRVAVAELEGRVTMLDASNRVIAHLGDNPDQKQWANYRVPADQWQLGVFTAPHGLNFDAKGNLLVMDWNATGRISRLELVSK